MVLKKLECFLRCAINSNDRYHKNYINLSTKMDLGLLTVNLCKNIIQANAIANYEKFN